MSKYYMKDDTAYVEKLKEKTSLSSSYISGEYKRPEVTIQDKISSDPELLQQKLKGFVQIFPEHYKDIECGIWIKYLSSENKYRSGGVLKVNKAPKYFILRSPYLKKSWSINLEDNTIFMKGSEAKLDRMVEKNNLFKLYEAGLVVISDNVTPEQIQAVLEK